MLPEVGGSELVMIAVVALLVVGPKDLPALLRKLGQFMGKLRAMAADFRASFDEMARQSELDELRREVEAMRKGQIADMAAHDASNVEISQVFSDIHAGLESTGAQLHPMSPASPPASIAPAPAPAPKPRRVEAKKAAPAAKPAAKTQSVAKSPAKPAAPRKRAKTEAAS